MDQPSKIDIYTDGACSTNGTWDSAHAFIAYEDDIWIRSEGSFIGKATNNIAELAAVLEALKFAASWIQNSEDIVNIYSDSAYIVNCINDGWYKKWEANGWITSQKTSVANQDLWKPIITLYKTMMIKPTFVKVKGHSTDKANIEVDRIAVLCKDTKQNYLEES